MSNTEHAAHHILPVRVYLTVGAALLFLTGLTVLVAQYNLGEFNLIVALLIACTKASLVVLFFMHLKYDSKLYATVFIGALVFVTLFIILTMIDTETRGEVNPIVKQPINSEAVIYQQPRKAGEGHGHEAASGEGTTGTADSTKADSVSADSTAPAASSATSGDH